MSIYGNPEIYARFLRNDWLRANNTRVHHKAYQPVRNIENDRSEVSCYETQGFSIEQICQIFRNYNITLNNKQPAGHCSILESDFPHNLLEIDRNYVPDRHIDIIGWEKYNSKEDIIELKTILAESASKNITIY
jgi:hypothetical protein